MRSLSLSLLIQTKYSHLIADNIDFFGFDRRLRTVEQFSDVRRIADVDALDTLSEQDRLLVERSIEQRVQNDVERDAAAATRRTK